MRFAILGPLEVEHDGRPVPLGRRRDRAVLALLVLADGRPVPVDAVIEALWTHGAPPAAREAVHTHVSRLRAVLRDAAGANCDTRLRRVDAGYVLDTGGDRVDAREFRQLVDRARAERDPAARTAVLQQALTLWRGDPLIDIVDPHHRERICVDLLELHRWAHEERIAADVDLGRSEFVIGELRRLVAEHPTRARPHLLLMRALHRTGRRPEALAVFRQHRDGLVDRLGVEPEPALRALQREILLEDSTVDGPSPSATVPAPRELPAAVPAFSGRHRELRFLDETVGAASALGARTVVISGAPGVGKTALAVQWAHRVAHRFPDGQLYTDLRGFSASEPVDPRQVIRRFLLGLGIPATAVPAEPAELYRSVLSGRRMLLLLDNARDAAQVRPLLPGAGESVVVVTSRYQLTPLLAETSCRSLQVAPLDTTDARELLRRRIGAERVAGDPDGAARVLERCGGLPLALALVAARATVRPSFALSALAADLADSDLDGFGDGSTGLRAVLSWSYRAVSPVAARLLRWMALHPGPTVGVDTCRSLLAASRREVRTALAELTESNLISELEPDRFAMHDLVRVFATELSEPTDPPANPAGAVRRMLSHYLHTASVADRLIDPGRQPIALPDPEPGVTVTDLRDATDAHRWFDREQGALLAVVRMAAADDAVVWRLAWALAAYQVGHGHWRDMVACQRMALRSAEETADPDVIALIHRLLGRAYSELGETDHAGTHFRHALEHYSRCGDAAGEATVRMGLAFIAEQRRDFGTALDHAERATALWRRLDNDAALAMAVNCTGWAEANLGNYAAALPRCTDAVTISRRVGHVPAEAAAWDTLGFIRHHLGEHDEAIRCYERAYALFRRAHFRRGEAEVLLHLGDSRRLAGQDSHARQDWERALTILESLAHPLATDARARLGG